MYSILIWTRHSVKYRHLKLRTKKKAYVIMFEKTQHLQFPVSPFRRRQTLKNVRHLLQSDPLSIPRICHRPEIRGNIVKRKLQNTANSTALTAGIYSPHYAESSITDRSIRLGFLLCLWSVMWTVAARRRLLGVRRGERHESPALAHSHQRRDASVTRVILVPWCWRLRSVACSAACWKGEGKSLKRERFPLASLRLGSVGAAPSRSSSTHWVRLLDFRTHMWRCGKVLFCARVTQHPTAQSTLGVRLRQQTVTKIVKSRELILRHIFG